MPSSCFIGVSFAEYMHYSLSLCPRSHHGRKLCYCKAIGGIRSTLLLSMTIQTGCAGTEKTLMADEEAEGGPKQRRTGMHPMRRLLPPGYPKCRVRTKLLGDTLRIEAMGRTIAKHKLVP